MYYAPIAGGGGTVEEPIGENRIKASQIKKRLFR